MTAFPGRRIALVVVTAALCLASHLRAQQDVAKAIAEFKKADSGIAKVFETAPGYAIFPSVGKGAIGIGGAHGNGYVYEGGHLIGHTSLTQVTIGFQFGGQAYREVIFFKDKTALDEYKRGDFALSAQASAVAIKPGVSADLAYNGGVAIVTMAKGGLMYEASVGGQKFSYKPLTSK